ncbi:hypothetical protein QQX10_10545 [Demequina sp. SYSU T00039]|uniref:Uncharacterized protein n=1 Tax=Demequina lignilytica TaxID=3051663 RepID=A0AAW7M9S5_9MICO|nr:MULTISPECIES: hypothetical protein [unclassified Demequina]MDN4478628.1 hypothetical protein [Demequina sp. SYSU T00039-1]MDN4488606.1 hypothetical protein [Demequina sp. SYSU T00039]
MSATRPSASWAISIAAESMPDTTVATITRSTTVSRRMSATSTAPSGANIARLPIRLSHAIRESDRSARSISWKRVRFTEEVPEFENDVEAPTVRKAIPARQATSAPHSSTRAPAPRIVPRTETRTTSTSATNAYGLAASAASGTVRNMLPLQVSADVTPGWPRLCPRPPQHA